MSRSIYFIFLLPFGQLVAMQGSINRTKTNNASVKKVIAVANALNEGVMAQLYNSNEDSQEKESGRKAWMRSISTGRIHVTPPHSPSITHVLVIRDAHDNQVLAQTSFAHPEDDTTFAVLQEAGNIVVRAVTEQDHPSHGRESGNF